MGGYFSSVGPTSEYLARMVPVHSSGTYVPFLIRNLLIALVVIGSTVYLYFGSIRFDAKRESVPGDRRE